MKRRIVFLCTGNSARSQMAEAWAVRMGSSIVEFVSAGTVPNDRVNPYAVRAMSEKGVDISGAVPKSFDSISRPIERVVAVCSQAGESCPNPHGEFEIERWDLPDPASATGTDEQVMEVFRSSRDEIQRRVADRFAEWTKESG